MTRRITLPRALTGLSVVALTALLWAVYGSGAANVDAQYAAYWGYELLHGRDVSFGLPYASTPHPLTVLTGAVLSLAGPPGLAEVALLNFLTVAIAVAALWWLAAEMFDRLTATVAAAFLLFAPELMTWMLIGPNDSLWIASLAVAGRLMLRDRDRPAPILAALAAGGLIRPETWLLAGLYGAYLWFLPRRRSVRIAAGVAAAPALWLAFDWVLTGRPGSSFTSTAATRADFGREEGAVAALGSVPEAVQVALSPLLLQLAAAGLLVLELQRPRQTLPVLGAMAVSVVLFVAIAAGGASVIPRYLMALDVTIVLLAATAVSAAFALRATVYRNAGVAVTVLAVVAIATQLQPAYNNVSATGHGFDDVAATWSELKRVVARSDLEERCGPVDYGVTHLHRPLLALHLGVPMGSLRDATVEPPQAGLHIVPTTLWTRSTAFAPAFTRRMPRPEEGWQRVRAEESWELWRNCPGGRSGT